MFLIAGIILLAYVLYFTMRRICSAHYPAIIVRYIESPHEYLGYEVLLGQGKKVYFEQRIWLPAVTLLFQSRIRDYFILRRCMIPYDTKKNKPFPHPTRLVMWLIYALCIIFISR